MASILLAEDSATQCAAIQALLEQDNHSVTCAADGRAALDAIAQNVPDLIVTDLRMPIMNGLELVEAAVARYPSVPIIVVTSLGSEDLAVDALAIGATNFVPKNSMIKLLNFVAGRTVDMARCDQLMSQSNRHLDLTECSLTLSNNLSVIQSATRIVINSLATTARSNPTTRLRVATAVSSALFNAVVYGNLELTDDEDAVAGMVSSANDQGAQLGDEEPFRDRKVMLKLSISPDDTRVSISHDGPGLLTRTSPAPGTPESFELEQCRSFMLMTSFMDDVIFHHDYSEVVMIKQHDS